MVYSRSEEVPWPGLPQCKAGRRAGGQHGRHEDRCPLMPARAGAGREEGGVAPLSPPMIALGDRLPEAGADQ